MFKINTVRTRPAKRKPVETCIIPTLARPASQKPHAQIPFRMPLQETLRQKKETACHQKRIWIFMHCLK